MLLCALPIFLIDLVLPMVNECPSNQLQLATLYFSWFGPFCETILDHALFM